MTPGLIIDRLYALADRARRLPPPNSHSPAVFHEARDELAHDIAAIAREVSGLGDGKLSINDMPLAARAAGRTIIASRIINIGGRQIEVQTSRAAFGV